MAGGEWAQAGMEVKCVFIIGGIRKLQVFEYVCNKYTFSVNQFLSVFDMLANFWYVCKWGLCWYVHVF